MVVGSQVAYLSRLTATVTQIEGSQVSDLSRLTATDTQIQGSQGSNRAAPNSEEKENNRTQLYSAIKPTVFPIFSLLLLLY